MSETKRREQPLTVMNFTDTDPVNRLKSVCKSGGYIYKFKTHIYKNGIICICFLHARKFGGIEQISSACRFVPATIENTKDGNIRETIRFAKRQTAATLLYNIGLYSDSDNTESEKKPTETRANVDTSQLQTTLLNMVQEIFKQGSEQAPNDGVIKIVQFVTEMIKPKID